MKESDYIAVRVSAMLDLARSIISDAAAYDIEGQSKLLQSAQKDLHDAREMLKVQIDD